MSLDRANKVNTYIRDTLTRQGIVFEEVPYPHNVHKIDFIFQINNEENKQGFIFVVGYDDDADSIIIATKSNVDLKSIPEYDILQWLNDKNKSIPYGFFVYEMENASLFLIKRIDMHILESCGEFSNNGAEKGNSLLVATAFSMFVVIENEESAIEKI